MRRPSPCLGPHEAARTHARLGVSLTEATPLRPGHGRPSRHSHVTNTQHSAETLLNPAIHTGATGRRS
jgi:hypothetical protein